MKIKFLIIFLVLIPLLGCAATPQKQESLEKIPDQFLGYWAPGHPLSDVGLHIHADGRINDVNNTNGDLIEAYFYKFIHSPDPKNIYVMRHPVEHPSYIVYYRYEIHNYDYMDDVTCTVLKEYSSHQVNIKDWNDFNQAKEAEKAHDMLKDWRRLNGGGAGFERCFYSKSRSF